MDEVVNNFGATENEEACLWVFLIVFRALNTGVSPPELLTAYSSAWLAHEKSNSDGVM